MAGALSSCFAREGREDARERLRPVVADGRVGVLAIVLDDLQRVMGATRLAGADALLRVHASGLEAVDDDELGVVRLGSKRVRTSQL